MRFKLTIEYAGTRYSGWQIQKNAKTVQGEIERAVREATGAGKFELYGSGRTDAGVHALGQIAHLDIDVSLPLDLLRRRVNDLLPSDITLLKVEAARHKFHARHDAVARSYIYQVSRRRTAFSKNLVWWVKEDLNLARMNEAAARFVGFHDFQHFSDDAPDQKSTTVMLEAFDIHEDDDLIVLHLEASHFLWKMARRLVGIVVEVGRGGLTADEAAGMLQQRSELPARLTAPASGLFLERVYYKGDRRDAPVRAAAIVSRP